MNIKGHEILHQGFYTYRKLIIDHKGETIEREQLVVNKVVAALVFDTKMQKYILVKQHRLGAGQELLEVVAGLVETENGNPESVVRKEIKEEIGYEVDKLEQIMEFYPSPGVSTEKVVLYYAEVSHKAEEGGGLDEEHEDIEVLEFSREELQQQLSLDAKTIIALQWLAGKDRKG
jgi:nudix-type nucleoside diphosphatase (YffH/AdpP family)